MNAPGMQPLSDAELDQLAERLDRIKNADALTLEGVDGLFSALIASPESMSPSEYLPVILGGDPGSNKIDQAALALLALGRHEGYRAFRLGGHGPAACEGLYHRSGGGGGAGRDF